MNLVVELWKQGPTRIIFSSKISPSNKFFWFDFQTGRQKLETILENEAFKKLRLPKNVFLNKEYDEYIGHFLLEFFYQEVVTYDPT